MVNRVNSDSGSSIRPIKIHLDDETASDVESTEGENFDGATIINDTPKSTSTFKKITKTVFVLKDKAESALGIAMTIVDQGRAVQGIAVAFFEPFRVLDKIFVPLRFLGWTAAPFVAVNFISNGIDFFTTPGFGKILPVMHSIVDVGVAAEMVANAAYLLEDIGVIAAQNISAWAAPLGGVAIGLQSMAIAINGWSLIEVTISLRKLQKAIYKNTEGEGYANAVDLLTKKPETKLEKFRHKFFKVLSADQDAKLIRIHEKVLAGELEETDMKKALNAVKHRFHLKQFGYVLAIVASVTGIIGVAILLFGPAPIAPVGWLLIAVSCTTSFALIGLNIYANKRLNLDLKAIDPEPLPKEEARYRKTYKAIRNKLKIRADGSTQIADVVD